MSEVPLISTKKQAELLQSSDISKISMIIPVFDLPEIVFLSAGLPNTRKAFGQQASV